jgi:hypothetical protein
MLRLEIAVVVLAALLALGFLSSLIDFRTIRRRFLFVEEYGRRFVAFVKKWDAGDNDVEADEWLNRNLPAMNAELGGAGRIFYRAPFHAYTISNLPLLTDTVPKISAGIADQQNVRLCKQFLLQRAGALEVSLKQQRAASPTPWCSSSAVLDFF